MTELHIKTLNCVKKQDTVGKDKAVLKIGGRTIGGPYLMAKGDELSVNITEPFTGSVQVTLMEEDAGADDNLGTVTVHDTLQPATRTVSSTACRGRTTTWCTTSTPE